MLQTRSFIPLCMTTLLLVVVPTLVARSSEGHISSLQAPDIIVAVMPTLVSTSVGETADLQVAITNPADLYAFDIWLAFEASVIQIDDGDPDLPGVQVRLGSLLDEFEYFVVTNHVDNEAGTIHVVASLLGPGQAINTDGDLMVMTVRAAATGASPLALTEVLLADAHVNMLPAELVDATIVVGSEVTMTPSPTGTSMPPLLPTPSSTSTPTPTSSPTPSPTATPTSILAPATQTPTATQTSTPTSTRSPTDAPTVTPTAAPTLTNHIQLPLVLHNYRAATAFGP